MTLAPRPDKALSPRRLLIIYNPTAGKRRRMRLDAVRAALTGLGALVEVAETGGPGDAERIAARVIQDGGADIVVAAGGDGTVSEVINGLLSGPGTSLPLGIIPLGTANVLARELALPSDPSALACLLAGGAPRPIHLGMIDGQYFSMMVGVGLDAHVVAGIDTRVKRVLGKGAYVLGTIRELARMPFVRYRIDADGVRYEAAAAIIANGHFYGGDFVCAPEAQLDRPDLQLCLFERPGRWAALFYAAGVVTGRIGRMAGYRVLSVQRVRIEGERSDHGPEPVQGDGDLIAHLPVTIVAAARSLPVLAGSVPTDAKATTPCA